MAGRDHINRMLQVVRRLTRHAEWGDETDVTPMAPHQPNELTTWHWLDTLGIIAIIFGIAFVVFAWLTLEHQLHAKAEVRHQYHRH